MNPITQLDPNGRLDWMNSDDIRPYVFVRPENRIQHPGAVHPSLKWFPHEVLYKNPLEMDQVHFADMILFLEERAFGPSGMAMPRWVFYDCAILPGFVAGFAHRTSALPDAVRKVITPQVVTTSGSPTGPTKTSTVGSANEWTPLSLFIIIPTMSAKGEWVAHNLCSINSLLPKEHHFYGIGFLSKAFSLWYANVVTCCGMTQWTSPAVRLHAHYGDFEVLTAYTPVHSYARTLTYRVKIDIERWPQFFTKKGQQNFLQNYSSAGFDVDPKDENSLKSFQRHLERGDGPYFLNGAETLEKDLTDPLTIFKPNS